MFSKDGKDSNSSRRKRIVRAAAVAGILTASMITGVGAAQADTTPAVICKIAPTACDPVTTQGVRWQ